MYVHEMDKEMVVIVLNLVLFIAHTLAVCCKYTVCYYVTAGAYDVDSEKMIKRC